MKYKKIAAFLKLTGLFLFTVMPFQNCGQPFTARSIASITEISISSPTEQFASRGPVEISGDCNSGIDVVISGDLVAPQSIPCLDQRFQRLINLSGTDGVKAIQVMQSMPSGSLAASRSFILDTASPVVRTMLQSSASSTRSSISIQGQCEPGLEVDLKEGSFPSVRVMCDSQGTFSSVLELSSPEGSVTIVVSQIDRAFNTGSVNLVVTKDATAPVVRFSMPAVNMAVASPFTVQGSCETGIPVRVFGARVPAPVTTNCVNSSFSASVVLSGSNGDFTLEVEQIDPAGNRGADSRSLRAQANGPVLSFLTPVQNSFVANSVNVTGTCESGLTVTFSGQGLASSTTSACSNGSFSATLMISSGDGSKNIVASQVNAAGLSGAASRNFMKDTTAPNLTWTSPAQGFSSQSALQLVGSCETGPMVVASGSGLSASVNGACNNGMFSFSVTLSANDGSKSFNLVQTDAAGNTTTLTRSFTRDTRAPTLTFTSPAAGTVAEVGLTVQGTCENGLSVNLTGSGLSSPVQSPCTAGSFSANITFSTGTGDKTVSISQTDAAGNTGTLSRIFRKEPPLLLDGPLLYANNCASCHNPLAVSSKLGRSASAISGSIATVPSMNQIPALRSLTAVQIDLIAAALDIAPEPPSPNVTAFDLECLVSDPRLPQPNLLMSLNHFELENTLVDLFEPYLDAAQQTQFLSIIRPLINVIPKNTVNVGMNLANHDVTAIHVERHFLMAEGVADYIVSQTSVMNRILGTCASTPTTQTCRESFINQFGLRALRRTVDSDSRNYYLQVMAGHADSYRNTIAAMISSPFFYYHNQFGTSADGTAPVIELDAFERANKLAYLLLQSMPDDQLFQAASNGSLMTPQGMATQLERLMAHPKVRRRLTRFFANQWLNLDKTSDVRTEIREVQTMLSEIGNPNPSTLKNSIIEEVYDYFDHMIWVENADYSELMTSPLIFPRTQALANIYGSAVWNGQSTPQNLIRAPSSERAGLLTRAQFLYTGSGGTRPIMRGVHVYRDYMCMDLTLPADNSSPQGVVIENHMTDQEITRATTEVPGTSCVGCHQNIINPLGFTFDNFDPLGKFRTVERVFHPEGSAQQGQVLTTKPTNSIIQMNLRPFITGEVRGAVDLSQKIAQSPDAKACFSSRLWNFAQKSNLEVDENPCAVKSIYDNLNSTNGSVLNAIRTLVTQPEFTKRRAR